MLSLPRLRIIRLLPMLIWLVISLIACTSHSDAGSQREWKVSDTLAIQLIHPGIWVHTSTRTLSSGDTYPSNGLLVRDGDALIMVDTAWGEDITRELLDWIETELQLPVKQAIVTHFHADSMGGAGVLAEHGIPFVAHPLTLSLGDKQGLPLPEALTEFASNDMLKIANLDVFYPGPGHSRDNLVVWIPEAKLLFGSCAVRSPEFEGTGNTADADVDNWPKAIQQVLDRYPDVKTVVPGHGLPGDRALLTHTIGLFEQD